MTPMSANPANRRLPFLLARAILFASLFPAILAPAQGPADRLPPHIKRITWFGERADFSHDGKRILFVEKTFGDVFEAEIATGVIRPCAQPLRTSASRFGVLAASSGVM